MAPLLRAVNAFSELSYDSLELNASDLCFVHGVDEKPSVIESFPPGGKFAPRVHRQCIIESAASHVFDIERGAYKPAAAARPAGDSLRQARRSLARRRVSRSRRERGLYCALLTALDSVAAEPAGNVGPCHRTRGGSLE